MLQDLRFRIVGNDASGPAFQSAQRNAKATDAAVMAMNGSLARANRSWLMLGSGASDASKLSTQQLANMQFQMQDMAVMLASGQSPFVLMMQQGSQIVQMFGPGTGVLGALKAVGVGLRTFLTNPLNLGLLALASASAAVGALFSAVTDDGADAEAVLERHAALIRDLKNAYGDAILGAEEYAVRSRIVFSADIASDLVHQRDKFLGSVDTALKSIFVEFYKTTSEGMVELAPGFEPFEQAIIGLRDAAAGGQPDMRAFREEIAKIADASNNDAGLLRIYERIKDITDQALDAAKAFDEATRAGAGLASLGTPDPSYDGYVDSAFSIFAKQDAMSRLKSDLGGDRKKGLSDAEKQANAVRQVADALAFEAAQLRRTAEEQELYNAMKQAGNDLTPEQIALIQQEVTHLQAVRKEVEAIEAANKAAKEAQDYFLQSGVGALSAIIVHGQDAEDVMKRLAIAIADAALQAALLGDGPLAALFGGGAGTGGLAGIIGGLLGGGGGGLPAVTIGGLYHTGGVAGLGNVPRRAVPSTVFDGAPRMHSGGIAGLKADEVPAILQRGEPVGRNAIAAAGGGSNGIKVDVGVSVDDTGALRAYVKRVSGETVAEGIRAYDGQVLPGRVKGITGTALRRGDI